MILESRNILEGPQEYGCISLLVRNLEVCVATWRAAGGTGRLVRWSVRVRGNESILASFFSAQKHSGSLILLPILCQSLSMPGFHQ